MATIFNKILNGEIPCHKVLEDDRHLALLDIRPIAAGHTLVIPKIDVDYIFDLQDEDLSALMLFAKKAALKVEKAVSCERIGIMVAGLEVPHAHIHLVPMNGVMDLNFANAREVTDADLARTARKINES